MTESTTSRHPIRVVVERTGLKPELIRAWERRYGAVSPARSEGRHRLYSEADIARLELLRRVTEAGSQISEVAHLSDEALAALLDYDVVSGSSSVDHGAVDPRLAACLGAARRLHSGELLSHLDRALVELGPQRLLNEVVAPLLRYVGDEWSRRQLRPLHEHFVIATVRSFLDQLILRHQPRDPAPTLLVSTPSGQRHELGALLVAAAASLEGWHTLFLGADLPAEEIAAAAQAAAASAVALSLVYPPDDPRVGREIVQLRRQLGPEVPILVGGQAACGYSDHLEQAKAERLEDLTHLSRWLDRLRSRMGLPPARTAAAVGSGERRALHRPALSGHDASSDRIPGTEWSSLQPVIVTRRPPGLELFLSRAAVERYRIDASFLVDESALCLDDLRQARSLAAWINARRHAAGQRAVGAAQLRAAGMVQRTWRRFIADHLAENDENALDHALDWLRTSFGARPVERAFEHFTDLFGPLPHPAVGEFILEDLWILWLANHNPAFEPLRDLFDDRPLETATGYGRMIERLGVFFRRRPAAGPDGESLFDLLRTPALKAPGSLGTQLEHILELDAQRHDRHLDVMRRSLDLLREEESPPFTGEGPPAPPPAIAADAAPVPARRELPFMRDLILMAKNLNVWLDQLSRAHGEEIRRLDQIPDAELDRLAAWGVSGLWLIGLWHKSPASRRLKRNSGQPEADASAYALFDYRIAEELGGDAALANLEARAAHRGIVLACDFVPNHMGLDSPWLVEHPEYFLSLTDSPYPNYSFSGEDLSADPRIEIRLEDHYADQSDAAVVFQRIDAQSGERHYVYHGNDGTRLPWNDTAQLDYSRAEVREVMLDTLVELARRFKVIRIDAAMALVKQHVQRLWFPAPGQGGAIPSRAEHGMDGAEFDRLMPEEFWRQAVERLAAEAPHTLLLAESFWMMEDYLAREIGMHRVYSSAFLHLLRDEDNAGFRGLLRDALNNDPRVLERWVHFLTTPDEAAAAEALGKGEKYFALATLLVTLPGLPLFGHGQVEGLAERYAMDYRRAHYTESPDSEFIARHERQVTPLLKRRELFARSGGLRLLDARPVAGKGGMAVEDVITFLSGADRPAGERVLVVVHNRQRRVRVRIHGVTAPQPGPGEMNLADLLGLTPSFSASSGTGLSQGRREAAAPFVSFRDLMTGREYRRPTAELLERGLELELGPHEHRVFAGFRAVDGEDAISTTEEEQLGKRENHVANPEEP